MLTLLCGEIRVRASFGESRVHGPGEPGIAPERGISQSTYKEGSREPIHRPASLGLQLLCCSTILFLFQPSRDLLGSFQHSKYIASRGWTLMVYYTSAMNKVSHTRINDETLASSFITNPWLPRLVYQVRLVRTGSRGQLSVRYLISADEERESVLHGLSHALLAIVEEFFEALKVHAVVSTTRRGISRESEG